MDSDIILFNFVPLKISVESLGQFMRNPFNCVIPAWSAGIRVDMEVFGRVHADLDPGNPCRHDENRLFHVLWASASSWITSWLLPSSLRPLRYVLCVLCGQIIF
jgi:hypothetical protein